MLLTPILASYQQSGIHGFITALAVYPFMLICINISLYIHFFYDFAVVHAEQFKLFMVITTMATYPFMLICININKFLPVCYDLAMVYTDLY